MDLRIPTRLNPMPTLLILACLFFLIGLNHGDLRGSTEPREAGVAAEMLQRSDFLLPTLGGEPFLEKPPGSYWLQAASIQIFSYEAFAPRLPSALAGIALIGLLAFFLRRSAHKNELTLLTCLLLMSMFSFWDYAQTAGQDMLLTLGISLALLAFYFTRELDAKASSTALWFSFSAGIAIATLAKGVVGLAIPGVVIFAFLLLETFHFEHRFTQADWRRPAVFTLLGLLPLLVWLALLYDAHGLTAVKEVVWANSVGRFQGDYSKGAHAEPFYFYLKKLPETFQPWSILLFVAIFSACKNLRADRRAMFFLCWLLAPFLLLSLSAGKRPSYLLMLYPAAAALLAHVIVNFVQNTAGEDTRRLNIARGLSIIQALILSGAAFYVLFRVGKIQPFETTATSLLPLLVLLPLWMMWTSVARLRRLFRFIAGATALLLITHFNYSRIVQPFDEQTQSARQVMEKLAEFAQAGHPIMLYQANERMLGAASYYLRRPVPRLEEAEQLQAALATAPATVVLIDAAATVDFSRFKPESELAYGKRRYRYISGK